VLVIAIVADGAAVSWRGRRHDDDEPEGPSGTTAEELFDTVFHALHDGEQTAVGVDCPLTVPVPDGAAGDESALLAAADAATPGASWPPLRHLIGELGRWRPWTAVTASPQRWLATQSVLVFETPAGLPAGAAVARFFDVLRGDRGQTQNDGEVVNLAVAAAVRSELTVERAELTRPALVVAAD
jgi:hypothetical protein